MRASHMHPLCKTYEEIKRCKERMVGFKINHLKPDDILAMKIDRMLDSMNSIIGLIPEEFQKTRHELAKDDTDDYSH